MSLPSTLEYRRFVTLQAMELTGYMDLLLADRNFTVPRPVVEEMSRDLQAFDEYHLVYALEILGKESPSEIATRLPIYLTYDSMAVRCAAVNALDRLPEECFTDDLLDSVRSVLGSQPETPFGAQVLSKLEARWQSKGEKP
jgi:hypothetical protein